MYLFECGVEAGDVLRIGMNTVSVEHGGDGPYFTELVNEKGEKYFDPNYPWFSTYEIASLSDADLEGIGEAVKRHLKARRLEAHKKEAKEAEAK